MDSIDHYSVKFIFQAHLRMYSLTHTDSLCNLSNPKAELALLTSKER
jgi:hypothetical protein